MIKSEITIIPNAVSRDQSDPAPAPVTEDAGKHIPTRRTDDGFRGRFASGNGWVTAF